MIQDKLIEIKISPPNRKKYEKKLGASLVNGEKITIRQQDLLPTSRVIVECVCDICEKIFNRKRVDVKNVTLCGKSVEMNTLCQ